MKKLQKGFTLVELLVVIAIIGVLATLVLLQLGSARAKARDTQRIATVNQVRTAIEQYVDDNNAVPVAATWDALCALMKPNFLSSCPLTANLSGMSYSYLAASKKFQVAGELETRASALDADADIGAVAGGYTGVAVNGATEAAAGASCAAAADCYYDQGN